MTPVLSLVAPVFGLIALGFAIERTQYLSPGAARIMSEFGYKVAMPALLFRAMAESGGAPASALGLVASYAGGVALAWLAASLLAIVYLRRPADDAPAIAMGCCFSNGVMLGIPLILLAFGAQASSAIAILVTLETVLLWVLGTLHMEFVRRSGGTSSWRGVGTALLGVARNPLILALAAGFAWKSGGLAMPEAADKLMAVLAQAAVPVSLVALGMSLADYPVRGEARSVAFMCLVKMIAYPAIGYTLATRYFELPAVWAGALLIYTSMPVGANAFLFATRYDKAVASVSAAVALSTAFAVVTATVVLALVAPR